MMLITPDYLREMRFQHRENDYGKSSSKWVDAVAEIASRHDTTEVLDYGCGCGDLKRLALDLNVSEYDPAIEGKDALPSPADVVVCTDVLEHVEPECIDAVCDHLRQLTKIVLFAVVALGPAGRTLSDGRNAHILLRSGDWWQEKFEGHRFKIDRVSPIDDKNEWVAEMWL